MAKQRSRHAPRRQQAGAPAPAPIRASRRVAAACLCAFTIVFVASEVFTYSRQSATWDEPGHLLAGYAALARSDYRIDIEHPPLLRKWSALPLLWSTVDASSLAEVDRTPPDAMAFRGPFELGHRFLYGDNDADRLLYRARFMMVVLGVLTGILIFIWAEQWFGFRAAILALVLYLAEPNLAAHAALVTTDFGVTGFVLATMFFAWRTWQSPSRWNAAALALFLSLAILSKFSALALVPLLALLLAIAVAQRRIRPVAGVQMAVLAGTILTLAIWGAYGFRSLPSPTTGWTFRLHEHPAAAQSVPVTAGLVGWIDSHGLLPNALSEGLLHGQGLATGRPAFLFGQYSVSGWWYYFPAAILLKTPITLLALFGLGLAVASGAAWPREPADRGVGLFLVAPIVVFLGIAMFSALNIGVRHVLPIYPFMILVASRGAVALLERRPRWARPAAVTLAILAGAEFAAAYPHTLAHVNLAAGGYRNGFRSLADSNVDWGQDLKPLGEWMRHNRVADINLAYFGTADPAYYGMNVRYLWGSTVPGVRPEAIGPPALPGYVAVSVTLLDGVPFQENARDFYKPLRDREPAADIGGSIRVYWVDAPWW